MIGELMGIVRKLTKFEVATLYREILSERERERKCTKQ